MSGHPPSILFLSKKRQAACTRYRASVFFEPLRRAGYEPRLLASDDPGITPAGLHGQVKRASVVVVCRRTFSRPMVTWLRSAARRLVFDFDDAIFTAPACPSKGRLRRFGHLVRRCDAVWAGNEYLGRVAGRLNPNVIVLPTSVDPGRYKIARHGHEVDRRPLSLVWIGTSVTRPYLEAAMPTLEAAAKAVGHAIDLRIVADFDQAGSAVNESTPAAHPLRVRAIPWSQQSEAASLSEADVGLAPMPANRWTKGKCGLKVLQYMAAGLPVVGSDVGVHRKIVVPGQTGFLCRTPDDWIQAIAEIHDQRAKAQQMGLAGRDRLERHYARKAVAQQMIQSLQALG